MFGAFQLKIILCRLLTGKQSQLTKMNASSKNLFFNTFSEVVITDFHFISLWWSGEQSPRWEPWTPIQCGGCTLPSQGGTDGHGSLHAQRTHRGLRGPCRNGPLCRGSVPEWTGCFLLLPTFGLQNWASQRFSAWDVQWPAGNTNHVVMYTPNHTVNILRAIQSDHMWCH